ncbi:Fc receptor-like protein 5 isoform X1 [Simochromis diagramma]|uniref:Fc receptor-like protein 5 isoform X1 n=1 Tax=Simochromis diagramma TaxID=43689 RepID=UPI001A7E581C|nr:Fc receptor-like protein 5 isoform X1 [Simochromis diagramma]
MGHSLLCLLGLFLLSTVNHGNTEELGVKATLTADRLTIPAGGSVTLTCDVKNSANFQYEWFREPNLNSNQKIAVAGESKRELVISKAGIYSCRGHKGTNSGPEESNLVVIRETGHGVNITVTADSTTIPAGGSVTLTCDVKHSADLKYEWVRETSSAVKSTEAVGSDKVIRISKGGKYQCRGWRTDTTSLIAQSDPVIIQETASKPRATLTAQSSVIPAGGSVTLSCSVEGSAGWKFDWFRRDSEFSGAQKIGAGTSEHTISISEGGIYYCRGGRGDPVFSTEDSAAVTIQKQVLAAVKLQHSWSQIFTGDTITLRCEIQGGETKVWKYEWTAPNTNSPPTSSEYRLSRVSVSHSGDYRCRGSSDYLLTGWSDAFRLTVSSSKPRATLTAQSSVIPAGGSVTLSCSVEGSAGWKFDWFRRDSVSSKAQLMRGNEANRVISVSQGGLYHCRGGRGDPVYYTEDSSDVTVVETSSKPRATLTAQSSVIPAGGSVTLSCSVEGSAGWKFDWFRRDSVSSKAQLMRGNEANRVISVSQGGLYHCRGGRGDPVFSTEDSAAVTIQKQGKVWAAVKLQHSWSQIFTGETITLRCEIQGGEGKVWKYEWTAPNTNSPPTSSEYRISRVFSVPQWRLQMSG